MTLARTAIRPRKWSLVLAVVAALGAAWILLSAVPADADLGLLPSPSVGFPAPEFKLPTADGALLSLSGLRGQVVVVNLWASWCPPCRAEMPALQSLHEGLASRGLVVVGINVADQDSRSDALEFLNATDVTFPVVFDEHGEVSRLYLLRALPSTFIIDRKGMIREAFIGGPLSESALRSSVEALLTETP